jgi:23S rRNA (uracil1939-C5)-methyltransferase
MQQNNLTITRLGHRGDGIAPGPGGTPVFVPRVLPGEAVTGEVTGDRLAAPRIVIPSEQRVSAPCRHYKGCGGCALQHATDSFVADWKQQVVQTALAAQRLEAPFRPIVISPPSSRRRAAFSARRTKKGAQVGFHAPASDVIAQIPDCLLITPALRAALPLCERIAATGASRKAEMSLTVTDTRTGLDVSVTGGKPLDMALQQALAEAIRGWPVARLTWDGETLLQETPPRVLFDGIAVPLPPGAFLQATEPGEAALRGAVTEAIGPATHVVDLFAGCGTFALPLARRAEVHAVEGDRALTDALMAGWRSAGGTLKAVTSETRDLFRNPLLPEDLTRFDAAVVDPPRAGAEAQIRALAEARIPVIAAVSCNPVTFARDAAMLVALGYRLDWVQVVDQFRWSPHVELAARLSLAHMP